MTFFTDLRDDVAGPLIVQFGQSATYRSYGARSYNNTTGLTTLGAPTDTTVALLDVSKSAQEFSDEVMARASAVLLASAKEFAAASVTPAVDDVIIFNGNTSKIIDIKATAPSGVPVIFKMAVQNA
jgi:hypothetical protein